MPKTVFVGTPKQSLLRKHATGQVIGSSKRTVFVGMSGGVDSSVTAALLKERGFKVVGVHLKCWNVDGCAEQDAEDARRAAEALGIPFYVFNFEKEYREKVVEYMVDAYKKGITPNPDVACNQEIKFGLFYKRAMELGADFVATGHYVRLKRVSQLTRRLSKRIDSHRFEKTPRYGLTQYALYTAKDSTKDQSYFLWTLTQEQLKHCLFPIGDYIKRTEVRKLAKKFKLPNAEKKDSQGICFIGPVSLQDFLAEYIPERKGVVVNTSGEVIGSHQGAQFYTIGQRRGIGVGGSSKPLYVAEKDIKKNILMLAEEGDKALYQTEVELSGVNFLDSSFKSKVKSLKFVMARVRYRQPVFSAKLVKKGGKYVLKFAKPQKFVAPGQSAVFYSSRGEMLGGGIIKQTK